MTTTKKTKRNLMTATVLTALVVACGLGLTQSCRNGKPQANAAEADSLEFPYVDSATARAYYDCATRIDSADVAERGAEIRAQKKLIAFDLDGTITQHKTQMTPEAKATLDALGQKYQLVMVGAGNAPRIYKQMNEYPIDIVANYGMQESHVVDGKFQIVREEKSDVDKDYIRKMCDILRLKYGYTEYKGDPVEFHESGMITFGLLGTQADKEAKLTFDPDKKKRQAMYAEVCDIFKDYAVYIGGTTSFDLAEKKFNKYDATLRYAKEHGFTKDQVLFVGDDFGDGGGDSHIRLGGMDYIQIYDYATFPERMKFLTE